MDYQDFTNRKNAFDGFIKYRKSVNDSISKGKFNEVFTDLCATAMAGDCVAQDCVAYFFNRGIPGLLEPNFDYYMSWQILAGANGNEFALEKMEFFLNPALSPIINDADILHEALRRRNITKDNAIMVISNLICEGIVDELNIDPKNLINITNEATRYSARGNRKYLDAMQHALPKVADFLVS